MLTCFFFFFLMMTKIYRNESNKIIFVSLYVTEIYAFMGSMILLSFSLDDDDDDDDDKGL